MADGIRRIKPKIDIDGFRKGNHFKIHHSSRSSSAKVKFNPSHGGSLSCHLCMVHSH